MKKTLLLLLISLTIFSAPCPLYGDETEKILDQLDTCKEDKFWKLVTQLELVGEDAIEPVYDRLDSMGPRGTLGCAKFLCSMGELDDGFGLMFKLIMDKMGEHKVSQEIKTQAAELLGVEGDRTIESRLEDALDQIFDPRVKIALAKALQQSCGNPRGRKELTGLLASDNSLVRLEASLALAELGSFAQSQFVLSRLKREPTPNGRISRALLRKDQLLKRYEELLTPTDQLPTLQKQKSAFSDLVLDEVYRKIKEYHIKGDEFSKEYLVNASIEGLLGHYDLESYASAGTEINSAESFAPREYGLVFGYNRSTLMVLAPIFGSLAYFEGIESGDLVTEINGWNTAGHSIDEVNRQCLKIKESKSPLTLSVLRAGWQDFHKVEIPCPSSEKILPSIFLQNLAEDLTYCRMGSVSSQNVARFLTYLEKQKSQSKMKGIFLDLRGCATGTILASVELLEAFLPADKVLFEQKGKNEQILPKETISTSKEASFPEVPLVIIVDRGTSFIAEMIAGALKHHSRGVVIGQKTVGQGSIQKVFPLKSLKDYFLKLTVGYYYFPSGKRVHRDYEWNQQGVLQVTGGLVPHHFIPAPPKEKAWHEEEKRIIEENSEFRKLLQDLDVSLIKDQLKEKSAFSEELTKLLAKWHSPLPLEAMNRLYREKLQSRYLQELVTNNSSEKDLELLLDFHFDPYLRLGVQEMLKKLGKEPKQTAFGPFQIDTK